MKTKKKSGLPTEKTFLDRQYAAARLRNIQAEITELLKEAEEIAEKHLPPNSFRNAQNYWLAHARVALVEGHEYAVDDEDTLSETIKEIDVEKQLFTVDKATEGGIGQAEGIRQLKAVGIFGFPAHSMYVGQTGIMVYGTAEQIAEADEILLK